MYNIMLTVDMLRHFSLVYMDVQWDDETGEMEDC